MLADMGKLDLRPRCQETISYFGGEYLCDLRYGHLGVHNSYRIFTGMLISPLENGQDTMEPICNAEWPFPWSHENGPEPHCTLKEGHQGQHRNGERYSWAIAADGTLNELSLADKPTPETGPIKLKPIDFPEVKKFDGLLQDASRPGAFGGALPDGSWYGGNRQPEQKTFQFDERTLKESLNTKIGVAIGAASMAWNDFRAGTFDSEYAASIIEAVMAEIENEFAAPIQERSRNAIDDLTEAIRLTVEYVGLSTLPPIAGWSWYDALVRYRPEIADDFVKYYDGIVESDEPTEDEPTEDERAAAWEQIVKHPIFEECLDYEIPLIDAMIKRLDSLLEPTEGETEGTSEDVTTTMASRPNGYNRREAVEIAIRISSSTGTSAENLIDTAKKIDSYLSNKEGSK